jgi:hypothetical protein
MNSRLPLARARELPICPSLLFSVLLCREGLLPRAYQSFSAPFRQRCQRRTASECAWASIDLSELGVCHA